MLFEDAHWIDPSSLELLTLTVARAPQLPLLLLVTARPEFTPPWPADAHVTMQALTRLGRREGATLVERSAGGKALPAEILEQILARTDGVPLFLEELTKTIIESGLLREEDGHYALAGALPPLAIPTTLHDSLMARLDRLAPVREVAQIGAAIGREFSYRLLSAVAQQPDDRLKEALDQLARAELVFGRGELPEAVYTFKHALVQEAAYASLLRGRRRQLHTRIAQALEADFADRVAAGPELLAWHLTEAGLLEKAVRYWQRAGERATERSANREAVAHLKRGLEVLDQLAESRERDERELLLQAALMGPFAANEGYASAAAERAAKRAVELGGQIAADLPSQRQAVLALRRLANIHMHRGELRTGLALTEEALCLSERLGDPHVLSHVRYNMGLLHDFLGDPSAARRHLEAGLALYDPERDRAKAARYGYDAGMACHSVLAACLWHQGFPDEALRHAEEAIAAARAASHPLSEAWALSRAAQVHQFRGEAALCRERAEAALALATEQLIPYWAAYSAVHSGWAFVEGDQAEEGLARLRAGIDAYRATGSKVDEPQWLALLAEARLATGRIEEGLSAVREALAEVEETAARYYEAELNRLEGELLLASNEPDESRAEASFRKAIAIARAQQAKSFELRAATSLARLWRDQGKRSEAHALLAPVYGWFTEGFDTADLKRSEGAA